MSHKPAAGCPIIDFAQVGSGPFPAGFQRFDSLQDDGARLVFAEDPAGSYYVALDRELILAALSDPELFSSKAIVATDPDPMIQMIPIQIDPPDHAPWRRLLAGYFSPRTTRSIEPKMRQRCVELIEGFREAGSCDFVRDFALRFPTSIFLEIVGLPIDQLDRFLAWEEVVLRPGPDGKRDTDASFGVMMEVMGLFQALIAERRANPDPEATDIISHAAFWEIDGEPIKDDDLLSCCLLLFLAGLDTVAMQLSMSMHHLATHPDDRRKVAAEPESCGATAVEELMRLWAVPELARKVTRDTVFGGVALHKDDMVLLPLAAASRDTRYTERAREFVLDRTANASHIAFGAGVHRCLGAHLARQELNVAIEEWHRRIPEYQLAESAPVMETFGSVHGLASLKLQW